MLTILRYIPYTGINSKCKEPNIRGNWIFRENLLQDINISMQRRLACGLGICFCGGCRIREIATLVIRTVTLEQLIM